MPTALTLKPVDRAAHRQKDPHGPTADRREGLPGPATSRPGGLLDLTRWGDPRGLTAAGAVLVALLLGGAGGLYDVLTGSGLRAVFGSCFVLGCGAAAALAHREDLRAVIVMPPLVYVALALAAGAVERTGAAGSLLVRQALELANALILGAPVLMTGTGLAAAVALVRALRHRLRR